MASPLTRNVLAMLGTVASGRFVRVLYLIAIVRLLEPEAVGVYAFGMSLCLSLMVFATFGQNLVLFTRLRRRGFVNRWLLINSFGLRAGTVTLVALAGLGLAWALEAHTPTLLPVLLFVMTVVPRSAVQMVRETSVAREQAGWIPGYELRFRGLEAIVGTALLLAGHGIVAVAAVHLGVYCIEAAAAWLRLLRDPEIALGRNISWRMIRALSALSIMFMASIGLVNLYGQLGVIVLRQSGLDLAAVGQFGIAMQLLSTILLVATVFGAAVVPAITRIRQRGTGAELGALATAVKLALLSGLGVALLAEMFAPPVIPLLIGDDFLPAAELFTLLCWATGPYAVAIVTCQSLNALDRRGRAVSLALLLNVGLVATLALLVPTLAATAGAVAVLVSSAAGCIFGAFSLGRRIGVEGHRWWLAPLAMTLACFLSVRGLDMSRPVMAATALGIAVLAVQAFRLVDAEDISFLLQRIGLRRPRPPVRRKA